ncbi:MAG: hypothetical protein SVZ03_14300 [Spirochaetota bacterium]|nr:hypothetical protein [Spirochaetota bacterium]
MSENTLYAIIFIQNWGESNELTRVLKTSSNVVSLFHIMGRYSYLIDANFDNKKQLEDWINQFKSIELSSGMPAIISLHTQKVIDVHKQKTDFKLSCYQNLKEKFHFFMMIDNPHHDKELIELLKVHSIVHSILHIQGQNSFIVEIISDSYDKYKKLLNEMKALESIHHIETLEVIFVNKYRNQILDEGGNLVYPEKDIREIYTL